MVDIYLQPTNSNVKLQNEFDIIDLVAWGLPIKQHETLSFKKVVLLYIYIDAQYNTIS